MGRVYTCGKCGARLNPNVKIIATYFITEQKVRAYGEHARKERVNFWGVGFTPPP
jgi:hypothetical protein